MGFILGVINVDGFFSLVIPKEIKEHYTLLIDHQGRTVFASHGGSEAVPVEFYRSSMLEFGSRKYSIRLRPSTERVAELSDNDDDLSLVIGALLSLLVSGAVYLAQRARRHNRLTRQANRLLKKEIEGRKHAETVLRETSTFRKAILNGANFIIVSTDREGLITSYNRTAELLLGYAADEAIGNFSLDQFMLTEELENYSEELGRRFGYNVSAGFEPIVIRTRDRIADEREWTLKCKNGSHLPVELSVTAIIEEDNEITGYLAIGRDNSRLYNTSQRLQESEERFKAVVNNTPSLVYIKDKEGKFVFSNNKFEDLLELEPGCLIGKTAYDITDEETAAAVREMEKRVLKTQRPEESVEVVKLPDGSTAHYMFVRFAIPTITREYCVGVIAVDISPQLAIEEELRSATTAAIESSRMKSEFLANMSHEIRTPMNGVLGMLEVLLDTPLNTSQREYADVIQDSAKSLLTILDDILDFSKLEAGKLAFETIEFDLRSTVENTVAMFADAAETKGIEISYLIERNVPTALLGDPGRFRQVLTNLVGNAVKFTEDGQITLTISEQESTGDSVKLKIDVEDTGIGITESAQKYLFDAFVQADGSMVRKYGGNGLGLSISKQLVELMKGEIGVKSEPGAGSRFTFTAQFNIQKNPVFKRPPVDLTGVKVLVADDLDTNRDSIVYQLQGLGIEAYQVPNGEDCLELLFQHSEKDEPFDIVLIDQEMPGLTGFETAEIIKQNPKIMDTRVVIMPSHGRRGHAHDAIRSGISAYLIKPIRQVELFDCVTTMMVGDDHERNDDPAGVSGLITRHSLLEKRTENGMPILIASDDVSNQNVLSMQLELLGYRSEVVSDAAEVSSALKRRDYSLIFVDFAGSKNDKTATQIREYLKDSIVPLVGISEQRAKPRPGFNACISLPVSEEEMARTIERLMNDETRPAAVPQESDKSRSETPTAHSVEKHIEELIEELGEEIAGMTVSLFTEDTNRNISELRAANRNGDFDGLQELAASIAETAETVGAQDLIEICNEITASRRNGHAPDLSETVERLDKEFDRVLKKLERLPLAPVEAGV
ncbi:MAG: PAS domain S-box protein [Pyrinomonadaceae bacterium]|nr:PAS domain S-box protein [Pyrinomonadaceae bacterium]